MKQVTAILIGAGDRGANAYASYALNNPGTIKFVGVVNRTEEKRRHFQKLHGISDENTFAHWDDCFAREKFADAVIIATPENLHYEPTKLAMQHGYHILLEKPITEDPVTSVEIGDAAKDYDKVFMLCYVLRYTPFYSEIKKVLESGVIGKLKTIRANENVGMDHYSHSYVRGTFGEESIAGPMILSKSSHDMDMLNWLTDANCISLSSYSTPTYFRPENAPEGAPKRCTDGCPVSDTCKFYAPKLYSAERSGFNVDMISLDKTPEGKMKALQEGRFGRCVYHCDNDVVDTQVINMAYDNGSTVSFSMSGYSDRCYRTIHIMGTEGEIEGNLEDNCFGVRHFATNSTTRVTVTPVLDRHSGGDYYMMTDFIKRIRDNDIDARTRVDGSVDSHVMCFASEISRKDGGRPIDVLAYKDELRQQAKARQS